MLCFGATKLWSSYAPKLFADGPVLKHGVLDFTYKRNAPAMHLGYY
jgi:hypothetical protein